MREVGDSALLAGPQYGAGTLRADSGYTQQLFPAGSHDLKGCLA